jgi:phospholipid-binding lipoprotein MlaA
MRLAHHGFKWAIAWFLPLLLGACAGITRDASLPVNDPNEDTNRQVMAANQKVLRPASEFVRAALPGPLSDRVHDLNSNLKEPRIFVNNVLQGRFEAAAHTGARFVINSTFGLGGLFDLASRDGLQQESGDFGQTLFVWGVAEGPYVVRPILGPSTLRDAAGSTVDMVTNPIGWLLGPQMAIAFGYTGEMAITAGTTGLDAADRLRQLKMAEDASVDFYSFIRSSYYQTRRAELREAVGLPPVVDSPALDDPDAGPAVAPAAAPAARRVASATRARHPAPAASHAAPASPVASRDSTSVTQ